MGLRAAFGVKELRFGLFRGVINMRNTYGLGFLARGWLFSQASEHGTLCAVLYANTAKPCTWFFARPRQCETRFRAPLSVRLFKVTAPLPILSRLPGLVYRIVHAQNGDPQIGPQIHFKELNMPLLSPNPWINKHAPQRT